jgi:EmrB/QacA subfamily drug resistance transporter
MKQQGVSPWAILAVTSLAVFAVMLDALVLFVAFPSIERSFSAVSSAELSWVLNGYTIVYGALLVPAGRLADRMGRKRVFLAGAALFTSASMLCGVAAAPVWLIAARVLQAVGGAMLTPTSLALTLAAFSQERRSVAVALWGAVGALAVVAGPPLGSLVVQLAGWPGIFFLNLPIGLAALLIGRAIIPESRDESGGALPDPLGIVLLIGGVALLAFSVIESAAWGWGNAWLLSALLGGVLILVGFVARSLRVASPALDLTLFRDRTFSLANAGVFVYSIGFTAMFFGSISFLTRIWGYTLLQAGLALMPGPLMVVLLAPTAGRLAAVYGHRRLLIPGGLIYAAGALVLRLGVGSTPQFLSIWLPSAVLSGMGVALILPVLGSAAVQNLPAQKLASGSGVNQAVRQFGTVLGVSLTFAILGDAPNRVPLFYGIYLLMITSGLSVSLLSLGITTSPKQRTTRGEQAQLHLGLD